LGPLFGTGSASLIGRSKVAPFRKEDQAILANILEAKIIAKQPITTYFIEVK
jgi:hypothetical protein